MNAVERRADRLFSRFIRERDGRCQLAGTPSSRYGTECWGPLECSHLLRRTFKATRWLEENAVASCAAHAGWYTDHPLAWNAWRQERLGGQAFAALLDLAYHGAKPDVRAIVEDLERKVRAA